MGYTVKEIYDFLDEIAPFRYSDKFDNTGLLIGDFDDDIEKILLTLDITNDIADEALNNDCELIISHHPVIFDPVKRLESCNPICLLLRYLINAVAFHTNFDIAAYGVSDILADHLGFINTGEVLRPVFKNNYKQISVYVPKVKAQSVYEAMMNAGAGQLGNYECCAFLSEGEGRFKPVAGANPYIGSLGTIEKVDEIKIEALARPSLLNRIVRAMLEAHPYEEPSYQILDNCALTEEIGYGRICELEEETDVKSLAEHVKSVLGCPFIKYTDNGKKIRRVAVCGGSGGGDYELAIKKGVDAYITGDVKHQHWIGANNAGLVLIDAGHFHTEYIAAEYLKEALEENFPDIEVEISETYGDIVKYAMDSEDL